MSTETTPRVDDDLEELWDTDIPCGGYITTPCPYDSRAVLVRVPDGCNCPIPNRFKCIECYTTWLGIAGHPPPGLWRCLVCGHQTPTRPRYVPL